MSGLSKIRARGMWLYFAMPPVATFFSLVLALVINDPIYFFENFFLVMTLTVVGGIVFGCPIMMIIGSPIIWVLEATRINGLVPYALFGILVGYIFSYPIGPLMVSRGEEPEDCTQLGMMVGVACGLGAYFIAHYPEKITLFRHAREAGPPSGYPLHPLDPGLRRDDSIERNI